MFAPGAATGNNLGNLFGLSPFSVGGQPANGANNPLVAPLTGQQTGLVNQAGSLGSPNSGQLPAAGAAIGNILNPSYPTNLANSIVGNPATQNAISAAVNPLVSAFKNTTVPGLVGNFTQAGQRVNTASASSGNYGGGNEGTGPGSSAFDRASGIAQNGLLNSVAQTSAGISNNAFQTGLQQGLQQQTQAINQAQSLSSTEVSNLVNSLQASALPQMIQQYGINQGLQLFQSQLGSILSALGLSAQASQPAIGNVATSSYQNSASPGIGSFFGTQGIGNAAVQLAGLFK